ncbi:MAG: type II secretion system protein, partial [Candidatus Beckwithbacteria bacterium]
GFTLIELLVVISIIGILASIGLSSFTTAQKKGRDAKRKGHLTQIAGSLESYYNDKQQYPSSNLTGQIMACGTDPDTPTACTWGTDRFLNIAHPTTIYMIELPNDQSSGQSYYYESQASNTAYYLCARLENTQDINIPKDVDGNSLVYDGPNCTGAADTCNYCISSSNIALPDAI